MYAIYTYYTENRLTFYINLNFGSNIDKQYRPARRNHEINLKLAKKKKKVGYYKNIDLTRKS